MTSLTLKPNLLRADTIDLQPQQSPSAKDHTRGQYNGYNHANQSNNAPHHARALRNATQEAFDEQHTSPLLGGYDHNNTGPHGQSYMYEDGDEDEDDHMQNGANGHADHEDSYDDGHGNDSQDEDMDDELLDKISSSPSIEDGKQPWPTRADSLYRDPDLGSWSVPTRGIFFSSSRSMFGPTQQSPPRKVDGSHQSEEPPERDIVYDSISFKGSPLLRPMSLQKPQQHDVQSSIPESNSIENITRYCLPKDDPFLEVDGGDCPDNLQTDEDDLVWEDEGAYDESSSDDDQDDFSFHLDSRFIDSGWGGECLREIEDIDFEFVYALHTFVATVEGQANATKGDTMVLLDDSNSYWWLVRVVKDGSIGYLPAEHIETPTERLARLNKHRNIDLSAAMLGDNPEKSRNPLKKAMRRRNAKTVNFAPPTYYEPEDREWSDDEDEGVEGEDEPATQVDGNAEEDRQSESAQSHQVQQVNRPTDQQRAQPATATIHRVGDEEDTDEDGEEPSSPIKVATTPPAALQTDLQDNSQRSRRGVVRNTDSFFKDDTLETKKISLTPRLLRGDSTGSAEQEVKQSTGLDTSDRGMVDDKSKDGKKKEEGKKKGMLSGLFKRKDKSGKANKGDTDEMDRASEESGRSPQSKDSMEVDVTPEKKPGKSQKLSPSAVSPKLSPTEVRAPQRDVGATTTLTDPTPATTQKQIDTSQAIEQSRHLAAAQQTPARFPSLNEKRSVFAPITGALRSKNSSQDQEDPTMKPIYAKRAKERFAIDDGDSDDDNNIPTAHSSMLQHTISPVTATDQTAVEPTLDQRAAPSDVREEERRSPVPAQTALPFNPRPETVELVAADDISTSPSDQTTSTPKHSPSAAMHTPSTWRSTPTWSDASLRSYMDNDQDIRDLLVIVHDKTNVQPVGPDHPLINGLFSNEKTKLADMQAQLDSLLMTWLASKNQSAEVTA